MFRCFLFADGLCMCLSPFLFGTPIPDCRQLLADKQVRFAGYMQPHPLENKIHIKVRRAGGFPLDFDVGDLTLF